MIWLHAEKKIGPGPSIAMVQGLIRDHLAEYRCGQTDYQTNPDGIYSPAGYYLTEEGVAALSAQDKPHPSSFPSE